MPIYQYQCGECDHQLEALQKMSDPKLVDCPECSASALKKQVTAAAFKLKGTGWYETDFKNSGAKPEAAKTAKADTSGAATNDSSTQDGVASSANTKKSESIPSKTADTPKEAVSRSQ